jgi:hypothetical protein
MGTKDRAHDSESNKKNKKIFHVLGEKLTTLSITEKKTIRINNPPHANTS